MHTLHFFTDIYGPRLTGSPNQKNAADWALKQMKEWGMENAHLEPWDFGHPGWMNERASGYFVAPIKDQLTFKVLAWTPGTNGAVTASVFQLIPPEKPNKDQLTAYLDSVKDKVKGRIVLVGKSEAVPVVIDVPARRLDDKVAAERFDPKNPNAGQFGPRPGQTPPNDPPGTLTPVQINEQIDQFLLANGAVLRANDAHMGNGRIRAFQNRTYDIAKVVPTVVLRNEDFGRITRILADGTPVELEFNITNRTFPEGKTSYNAIAEIPGADRKDEIIMLGGHLDSWHSATGATDNAIGCAIMMEAARILKSLGVRPRRTIRVALWSGEEEGLLGSQAYVKQHFGSAEDPKPEFTKLDAYFNVDSGTGRIRGAGVFGPPADSDILREALAPFADLGVMGAISTKFRRAAGTDSGSFAEAGLPGIGLGQDPIEYFTDTWHTNLDTYERIIEDDVKKDAIVVAAAIYQLAMRDEMLPRFSAADMPAKTAPPGTGAAPAAPAPAAGSAQPARP
ncbi:MAG: M20/M25/M40 family metallo-hydrolase [Acidobacteriia bacterium]|nr:M20/M25/M40 family metallo-hydrolase [Terriglobia bacterium]